LYIGITAVVASPGDAKEGARTIAVGPFFAPDANDSLRQISANIPDLLTVELSQQDGFHVVERQQVTAIWKELNLSTTGLVTSESVAHLGNVLACDWLITGTLVPSNARTQIWVKVIDVKSSVVLDMQTLPFEAGNLSATIQAIAAFVAKAGSHRQTDRFVTLGRFTDLSTDSSREDWSRRLRALIEQHCRDGGMGLVEREAIGTIFEEFQFERAGMTGALTNRVRLQAAFWIVDGACKWVHDTEDKVTVSLRLQKVGGSAQIVQVTKRPGPELESAVLAALRPVLAPSSETTSDKLGLDESKLHNSRGMDAAANNDQFSRFHSSVTESSVNNPQRSRDFQDNRHATLESFEKALLLNPKDVKAKYMLGYGLIGDPDPAQRERAKELLKEVVVLNDPTYSKRAALYLEHPEMFIQDSTIVPANAEAKRKKAFQAEALERFGKAFELNPTSVQAKFDYGMVLINEPEAPQKKHGKELLKEVADLNNPTYSKFAVRRLEADQIEAQGGRMTQAQIAKAETEGDEAFEQAYRQNPKSVYAKLALGNILVSKEDVAQRERGKQMLREIVALNDPKFSKDAAWHLEHGDMFRKNAVHQPVRPPTTKLSGSAGVKMEIEASEKSFRLNPANAQAKYDYGFALLKSNNDVEKERGKELLKQVADSNDATYSKIAATRLQQFESQQPATVEKQAEFLKRNFSRLVPMQFEAPTNTEAKIQILHVKDNLFEYEGRYYCGFQFTAPEWLDGDLQWIYLLAKTETNKDFFIDGMLWYILPQSGEMKGLHRRGWEAVSTFPHLKQRFPFTSNLTMVNTDKERLEAGKPNAFWFSFSDQNVCDIAFAMTIHSERGAKEFGVLPLQ
jgi:cytochrome c-type biogenesis protein CcmH/NrfG/TolB-like protein